METLNWGNFKKLANTDLLDKTNIAKYLSQDVIDEVNLRIFIDSSFNKLLNRKARISSSMDSNFDNLSFSYKSNFENNNFIATTKLVVGDNEIFVSSKVISGKNNHKKIIVVGINANGFSLIKPPSTIAIIQNDDGTYSYLKKGIGGIRMLDKHEATKIKKVPTELQEKDSYLK